MVISVLKLAFFLVLWFVSGIFFLPTLLKKIRSLMNEETLLIFSLALCFLMVVQATYFGFSPALGAFIMGSILAETTKAEKIEHLTKSVKNLFGAIFFVSVGMLIDPAMLLQHILPIAAATLVLLLGKPLFVSLGAVAAGQPLKIAVQSGMSLSQIGEFSFIIATLGLTLNVTSNFLYPVAVAVSVLTAFTTPYMIKFSDPVYKRIEKILPQKWNKALSRYNVEAQNITEISDWKKILRFYFVNVVLFSVIIITIILLSTKYIAPYFADYKWGQLITVGISLIILSPFLWALAFRRTHKQAYANIWVKTKQRGPLLVLLASRVLLAILFIGFLFDRLFSPLIALIGVIVSVMILALLSKKIKAFYGKIEMQFLTNYNERETGMPDSIGVLSPWDSHITTFEINPKSPYIGKTLFESKIREEFGVNIAVIDRGDLVINVPNRAEYLYPNDKLSVIGTDEQLEKFKLHLDSTAVDSQKESTKQIVSLHHFTLGPNCPLLNRSIRESKLRERSKGLIVGIERNGKRILNPESDLVFEIGDKVWIVGNELRIQVLIKELTA
jgi:CPA2 family monovalent cation:H+ antiporter-2